MTFLKLQQRFRTTLCLAFAGLLLSGCAQFRLPRIDPSGNTIFLPANNPTASLPVYQPVPMSNAVMGGPQLGLPTTITPPELNQPARPVGVQPAFQPPPVPPKCGENSGDKHRKHLIPDPNRRLSPGEAGQLIMTPSRIVAPVGSEVVVLAGICGPDGYFLKNQPLEWMMSNNSVGEFIEVGGMYHSTFNALVPPSAKKIDGQYAWGRTGLKKVVISRGTPTTVDDIEMRTGQTFISVASSSPGTSYITGVAPKAEGWDRRRATTVIHWVDANWAIPVPSRATAGTVAPLTTVVSRGDGKGVNDWTVRYSIVGGAPAEFAPGGSQTADARTNRDGQATVQIRQPAGQFEPGTTQVRVDVIRPPVFGESELTVESGITSVSWSSPALTIRAIGPQATEFDTPFSYKVEVTNPGDQPARGVIVRTKDLDDSVEFISSNPKPTEYGRQYEWQIGDIAPGAAARTIELQLRSKKLGNVGLCFEVASLADGLQTEACAKTEIIQPCIGLAIQGPQTASLGQQVEYQIRVENRCDQALENVEMQITYDPGLARPGKPNPTIIRLDNNGILQVNDSATFPFVATAQGAGQQCISVQVTANGVRPERDRVCVNVGPASGAPVSPVTGPLQLEVLGGQPVQAQGPNGLEMRSRIEVRITNQGSLPLERVTLNNRPTDALEAAYISRPYDAASSPIGGGEEILTNIPVINPGQTIQIEIDYFGRRTDPNASAEITVSSPTGGSQSKTVRIPAVLPNSAGAPEFGTGSDAPIGIPGDAGASGLPNGPTEPVTLEVRAMDRQIRLGQAATFRFSIRNNTSTVIQDLDINFVIPNWLQYDGEFASQLNLSVLNGSQLPRIRSLPPGEQQEFLIKLTGKQVGEATFEVQLKTRQSQVPIVAFDTVEIVN